MKSLKESLFDRDLADKDITFGDVFKWESSSDGAFLKAMFSKEASLQWQKYMSVVRIKKDSKISCDNQNETIYKGLLKLVENIVFSADNMTTDLFEDYLTNMMKPYYQYSLSNNYKHSSVQIYRNGSFVIGQEQDMLNGNFDEIKVFPCPILCFTFKRK